MYFLFFARQLLSISGCLSVLYPVAPRESDEGQEGTGQNKRSYRPFNFSRLRKVEGNGRQRRTGTRSTRTLRHNRPHGWNRCLADDTNSGIDRIEI